MIWKQTIRLKRRLDDFEDKDRLLQHKRARQNKQRKRMESEIRQRVRIEEREREGVRKEIFRERRLRRYK